jgi:hydrogenase maturation protease
MIRILGCGNPLVGDDGIGVHIANKLMEMRSELPDNVEVIDAGVGGLELLNFMENAEQIIIVDAVKGAGNIGSVHRFEIEDIKNAISGDALSIHDTSIADVLCIAQHVQEMPKSVKIFAIEIEEAEEVSICLSEKVQASVDEVISMILDEIKPKQGS